MEKIKNLEAFEKTASLDYCFLGTSWNIYGTERVCKVIANKLISRGFSGGNGKDEKTYILFVEGSK
jgi:hypothetical protein